ncbi:unnamed protein product [Cuscuta campestris]|uniref:Uncharacterized protein n=1 Tax=Cuscuta campestris TaxID=132261 RepID=A0A484KLR3_9ASTE|nr:unnamed protein product [Cuscuta campestris]
MSEIVIDPQAGFKAYADPHIIEGRTLKQDDIRTAVLHIIHEQGLVKVGNVYYMKREFQNLDAETRAVYGPRRSMSSLPSTSQAPKAEANENPEVPVHAPRVKRSKSASHASSASLLHRHSHMSSSLKNPSKKFKKFILKTVLAPMKKLQESTTPKTASDDC